MNFFALAALVNGVMGALLGLFVFFKNKKSIINITFSLFCLSVTFWSYAYYFWQISETADYAYFWCRVLMLGAIFITITYLHFVFALLGF